MSETTLDLTPETLARLANMELRARVMVEGHFSGQHHSHFKGASVEFADHRNYAPGDELRHLDWKLYGRTDRYFVKQYDAETNLSVMLALDASGSMGYGSGALTKLRYAAMLAAGLAYLTSRQGDAPGLALLGPRVVERLMPATRPAHLRRVWERLEAATPAPSETGEGGSLADGLAEVATVLARRGLLALISDLLEPPARLLRALQYFRHRGHDVIVLQVLDPVEVELDLRGTIEFEDLETGRRVRTEVGEIRRGYRERLQEHQERLITDCRAAGVDHALMLTNDSFGRALAAYLGRRARIG